MSSNFGKLIIKVKNQGIPLVLYLPTRNYSPSNSWRKVALEIGSQWGIKRQADGFTLYKLWEIG